MHEFFDLTEHTDVLIPMYGTTHLITAAGLVLLLLLTLWQKDRIKKLVANKRFIKRFMIVYLLLEVFYWSLIWGYRIEPFYERFPLHLCGSLSILMPILILTDKQHLFRFFSYWSISAGFISFANPGFVFYTPGGWGFIHYVIRHYFLFLAPIIFQIGWGYRHTYKKFLGSLATLAVYAFLIFLLDWAIGANYDELGPNNPLEVPFLPASFTAWPWSFPSFSVVGIILLHLAYFGFKWLELVEQPVELAEG
ncbi:MAG: TMEM164-related integral membrane acyltransferase [Bacteroidales bacterium]